VIAFFELHPAEYVNRPVDLMTAALSAVTAEIGVCRFSVFRESAGPCWIVVAQEFMAVS